MGADSGLGLTIEEAARRLASVGPNEMPASARTAWRELGAKFGGPVPAMLIGAAALEAWLGRYREVAIIGTLLVVNGVLGFFTEDRARRATELLRARLELTARVLRAGAWSTIDARELVPGDVVRVRVGDVLPADLRLLEGDVLLDTSSLTGESAARSARATDEAFAGTTVVRGEATASVEATGVRTRFGRTAELVATSERHGHLGELITRIVRALLVMDAVLVAIVLLTAWHGGHPMHDTVVFAVALLVAAVPIALPATFTLTEAIGSIELTQRGVFVTHLASVEAAASMDVLCCDKTGTLTENQLAVDGVSPAEGFTRDDVLSAAAACSDGATRDPIDVAILAVAPEGATRRTEFVPFDPSTKRSEAWIETADGGRRTVKGAPRMLFALAASHDPSWDDAVRELASHGARVLAVATSRERTGPLTIVGFVGLRDRLRSDSRAVVDELKSRGIRVCLVTGDGIDTARAIGSEVGLTHQGVDVSSGDIHALDLESVDVIAGVYPEGKHALVDRLSQAGHVVGMTGDGVNDAPALRLADVGIAVANATDVAKAAASVVLARPGVAPILDVIEVGRKIHQRLATYTINKLVKTIQISLFLAGGFVLLREFVVRPRHVFLLLLANDLVTMSISTDRVVPSREPNRWDVRRLLRASLPVALVWTAFSFGAAYVAERVWRFELPNAQTISFVALVASGQANVYVARARASGLRRPSRPMLIGTTLALVGTSGLAWTGTLTTRVPAWSILAVYGASVAAAGAAYGASRLADRWSRVRGASARTHR